MTARPEDVLAEYSVIEVHGRAYIKLVVDRGSPEFFGPYESVEHARALVAEAVETAAAGGGTILPLQEQ